MATQAPAAPAVSLPAGQSVTFTLQADVHGDGTWTEYAQIAVPADASGRQIADLIDQAEVGVREAMPGKACLVYLEPDLFHVEYKSAAEVASEQARSPGSDEGSSDSDPGSGR